MRCCAQVQENLDEAILLNAVFRYGMETGRLHFFHRSKCCIHDLERAHFNRQMKGQGLKPPMLSMCARAWAARCVRAVGALKDYWPACMVSLNPNQSEMQIREQN